MAGRSVAGRSVPFAAGLAMEVAVAAAAAGAVVMAAAQGAADQERQSAWAAA